MVLIAMTIERARIELSNRDTFITEQAGNAYWVQEGMVEVYIVPKGGSQSGRRQLLCTAREDDVVPAFCYRDADYQNWRFCLSAVGPTVLCEMADAATDPLRSDFLLRVGLFDEVGQGFDDCLVNCYRRMLATDFGLIMSSTAAVDEARSQTEQLVRGGDFSLNSDGTSHPGGLRASTSLQNLLKCMTGRDVAVLCGCAVTSSAAWVLIAASVGRVLQMLPFDALTCALAGVGVVLAVVAPHCQQKVVAHLKARMQSELASRVILGLFDLSQPVLRRCEWADLASRVSLARHLSSRTSEAIATFFAGGVCSVLLAAQLMWYSAPFALVAIMACVAYGAAHCVLQERRRLYDSGALRMASESDSVLFQFVVGIEKVRTASIEHRAAHEYMRHYVKKRGFESHAERCDARAGALKRALGGVCALALCIVAACLGALDVGSFAACLILAVALVDAAHSIARSIGRYRSLRVSFRAIDEVASVQAQAQDLPDANGDVQARAQDLPDANGDVQARAPFGNAGTEVTGGQVRAPSGCVGDGADGAQAQAPSGVSDSEAKTVAPSELPGGGISTETLVGDIDIDHVTFSYETDGPATIVDVTLHIAAGESIGIVGPSGCGKSTLLSLLLGFEEPDKGTIRFDGRDLRELDVRNLRRHMGVVLQGDDLIPDSICENIMLTLPKRNARETERLVFSALDEVGLLGDVSRMPMGIATRVGEGGCALSEGQRQRILIARALVREPSILLLDEATSALDGASQQAVSRAVERHPATKVIVAHRLSTVRQCDRIIVLDAGRIVQEGTYDELMLEGGLFSQLANV